MSASETASMRWMARGEHEVPATGAWLTEREATYAASLRFTKRRSEFLLRRWVSKHAVVASSGLDSDVATLARIEVGNRLSGAPYVEVDGSPAGFDISITDRAGWAVCVVGGDLSRVGCDLEIVEPRSQGFITDFLTPAEQEYVRALPDGSWDAAANLLWSAKESALKVLQTGLRRDTRSVEVHIDAADLDATGWQPLEVRASEGTVFPGWWRRDGSFVFTVAAEEPVERPSPLAGTADLATARPTHSWVTQPLQP